MGKFVQLIPTVICIPPTHFQRSAGAACSAQAAQRLAQPAAAPQRPRRGERLADDSAPPPAQPRQLSGGSSATAAAPHPLTTARPPPWRRRRRWATSTRAAAGPRRRRRPADNCTPATRAAERLPRSGCAAAGQVWDCLFCMGGIPCASSSVLL